MIDPFELTQQLVRLPSITPQDSGCQQLLGNLLVKHGFHLEHLPFGTVDNLWAVRGNGKPFVIFAGHTDVVPPGNEADWKFPPFSATCADGKVFGRGVADMKGSIAAFITALKNIRQQRGSIGVLLTSDEEGKAIDGTVKVVKVLQNRGITAEYVVVGEPSSTHKIGDCSRVGRRGSLSAKITVGGTSGHVAYPQSTPNLIAFATEAITSLNSYQWDVGDEQFPPTSLQWTSFVSDSGAINVTPAALVATCNLRYNPRIQVQHIQQKFNQAFMHQQLAVHIDWHHSAVPFICPPGDLRERVNRAVSQCCGYQTTFSTAGGTSDGRFLIAMADQLIELGPINATIHQANECLAIDDIYRLRDIYTCLFNDILG